MEHAFLGATPEAIRDRLREAARTATGVAVEIRVGPEGWGYRNVGVDLPRARRSKLATRNLRVDVSRVLEACGVTMAHAAIAPRVFGELEGSVRVRLLVVRGAVDASSLARAAPPRGHVLKG